MAASDTRFERNQRVPTYLKQALLRVDETYQSVVNPSWVRQIADGFDPDLFRPLDVSARTDGTFWVVDGRHRLEAVRLLGWLEEAVPCFVYRGLSVAQEAALFYRLNAGTRKKRVIAVFRARLAAGEPVAFEVARVVSECGFELATTETNRGVTRLLCVGTLEAIHKAGGVALLRRVLSLLHDTWAGKRKVNDADFIRALFAFVLVHGDVMSDAVFVERLSKHDPESLLVEGRAFSRATTHHAIHGYYFVLVQHYNFRLREVDKLTPVTKEQYGAAVRDAGRKKERR